MSRKKSSMTVGKKMGKLEWQARFVVGKVRSGSSLTRNDQLNCLGNIGKKMEQYGLNSIKDLKPRHVERYFAELRDRGLSAGRMANHASAMRRLCSMMGKGDIVPSNAKLGCARDIANRTKHADVRLDVKKYGEVLAKISEHHQIACSMARHFGLRQKESLLSHKRIIRDGVEYLVVEGAKGGRPREIPITTAEQKANLERNLEYRAAHGGKLIDETKSLRQGIKELQNVLFSVGASRQNQTNMHTVRREWIIERCLQILAAPVADREAMIKDLVEQVGHGREEVIRCYTRMLD